MKNKTMRWLTVAAALLCLIVLISLRPHAEETADPPFSGQRTIVYEIDSGLLPNYLVGGRTALEGYLRVYQPEWLSVSFTAGERTTSMTLDFTFETMQDYREKLQALSLRSPVLLYTGGDNVTYCENLTASDLLNFLRSPMKRNGALGTFDFARLFRPAGGSFQLNGQTYEATSPQCINRTPVTMKASQIVIQTTARADGVYERSVLVTVREEDATATATELWKGQMSPLAEEVVSRTQGTAHQFGVSFTAAGAAELAQKTMQALNVDDTATETVAALDGETVSVALNESLDLTSLLDAENGKFSYTFTLGNGCDTLLVPEELSQNTEEQEPEEGAATNQMEVTDPAKASALAVGYHRPFRFSSVEVITDLTDPRGRLGRTIRYTVPLTVAEDYHSEVTDELSATLVPGQTLEIYDTMDSRCYEIRFGSWFPQQFTEMTQAQFPSASMELQRSWLPFLTSSCRQSLGNAGSRYAGGSEAVRWQVLLPDGTTVTEGQTEGDALTVTLTWKDSSRRAWLWGTILAGTALLILLLLTIVVLVVRHRWKKRRAARGQLPAKTKRSADKKKVKRNKRQKKTVAEQSREPAMANTSMQEPVKSVTPVADLSGKKESVVPAAVVTPAAEPDAVAAVSPVAEAKTDARQEGFCEMCGEPLKAGQKFCGRCGHRRTQ